MSDRPIRDLPAAYGGRPPAVHPRASGTLPWDLDAHAGAQRSVRSRLAASDVEDEIALLEELDEVLSSTTSSKASKSTTESRVAGELLPTDPNTRDAGQEQVTSPIVDLDTSKVDLDSSKVDLDKVQPVVHEEAVIKRDPGDCDSSKEYAVDGDAANTSEADGAVPEGPEGVDMFKQEKAKESVNMWSIDEDSALRGQKLGQQESRLDQRTPRYQGKFANYEEMLEHMEANDPFGNKNPVSDKKPPSRSTTGADKPRHTRSTQPKNASNRSGDRRSKDVKRGDGAHADKPPRRLRKSKSEDVHERSGRNGFNNPSYEPSRRGSADSTKTYIVGRTDSRSALVDDEQSTKPSKEQGKLKKKYSFMGSIPSIVAAIDFTDTCGRAIEQNRLYDIDKNLTKNYTQRVFRHRQCSKYIPASSESTKCGCGREKWMHQAIGVSTDVPTKSSPPKWNPKDHTCRIEASSFGNISFHGFGQESQRYAPYLRVEETMRLSNDSLHRVWELLSEIWEMAPPKMLVSVTGGAKRFFMKNRLKNSFKRGLINVATSSGAWIITGGTGTGVMQFVGEAVREHQLTTGGASGPQVVALGIATWGILDDKQALISDGSGNFPAHYSIEHLSNKKGTAPLDPNHTHFLLVDDGTHCKFGKEIAFRAALESYISNHLVTGVSKMQRVHVPVVLLVLEGGVNTLETVYQALEKRTPVVIIQGSGRAADFMALAYKEIRGWDDETKLTLDEDIQRIRASTMFDWKEGEEKAGVEKVVECLKKILSPRNRPRVTIFHMDDVDTTTEIDEAILFSLLKAKRTEAQQQLNLALAWNRCDVARQQIFDLENRSNWQTLDLNKSMLTALLQDRPDFVQLFMDNGVDLNKFLTRNTLRQLYAEVVNDRNTGTASRLLLHLLQEAQTGAVSCFRRDNWRKDMPNLLRVVGRVMIAMLGEHQDNPYADPKYIIPEYEQRRLQEEAESGVSEKIMAEEANLVSSGGTDRNLLPDKPLPAHMRLHFYGPDKTGKGSPEDGEDDNGAAERNLFFWAIMLNRQDLARLFWRAGQDHIGGALVASSILKSLADQAEDEEELDLAQDLYKNSQEWEDIAVGVLTDCHQRDKEMSHSLLTREIPNWGNSTLFVMADSAEQMDFMGHSCCQTKLNRIWKGKMALHTPWWKIIIAMFMPFFLPLIRFSTGEFGRLFRPRHHTESKASGSPAKVSGSVNQIGPGEEEDQGDEKEPQFVRSATRRRRDQLHDDDPPPSRGCLRPLTLVGAMLSYHQAPITKFCFHTLSYLVFLGLFSYFVLIDLAPSNVQPPSYREYIVWGWAATLFIEEMRQLATQDPKTFTYKLAGYFESNWNRFDLMIHIMLIISIILRHVLTDADFVWPRMFYAVTLSMYFLRFMQVFFVDKNIGPKVIMIRRMLTDLAFFIAILLTVILAYGVAVQALRFPNSTPNFVLLKDVLYKPYWHLYGELFLEDLEGEVDNCSNDEAIWGNATSGMTRCPQKNALVILLLAAYMMMTNILLLNLLIAMFSYTFERVQENSEKVWRYYRYSLVYEYFDKPTLAPPLIIISHMIRFMKFCWSRTSCANSNRNTDFRKKLDPNENRVLTAFERSGMENFLLKRFQTDREHIDAKVSTASDRIEKVIEDLEQIKEQVGQSGTSETDNLLGTMMTARDIPLSATTPRFHHSEETVSKLQERVVGLEKQLSHQGHSLEQMITLLKDMKTDRTEAARHLPPEDHGAPYGDAASVGSGVSSGAPRAYRRVPHHPDPQIEIQDIRPTDT